MLMKATSCRYWYRLPQLSWSQWNWDSFIVLYLFQRRGRKCAALLPSFAPTWPWSWHVTIMFQKDNWNASFVSLCLLSLRTSSPWWLRGSKQDMLDPGHQWEHRAVHSACSSRRESHFSFKGASLGAADGMGARTAVVQSLPRNT